MSTNSVVVAPPAPHFRRSQLLHLLFTALTLAFLVATQIPRFAPYALALAGACGVSIVTAVGFARAFLGPRICAILDAVSPTPVPTQEDITTTAKIATKVIPLILVPLLMLQGCAACKLPANATTPKCVLEANLISCGEQDGFALLPVVIGIVGTLIAGNTLTPAALVLALEQQGARDVPCVLAAFESYLGLSSSSALLRETVHDALKLSLAKRGRHGEQVMKLPRSASITVVVP